MVSGLLTLALIVFFFIWSINAIRKILIHWKYLKVVENRFEGYSSYFETAFSFNMAHFLDLLPVLLPFYSRNKRKEKTNSEFSKLGRRLKRITIWSWIGLSMIIFIQMTTSVVSLFIDIDHLNESPDARVQAAHDFVYEQDSVIGVVFRNKKEDRRIFTDGLHQSYYSNGNLHQYATFENGDLNGEHMLFYTSGKKKSSSMYKDGERNGMRYDYYPNGQVQFESEYRNALRTGVSKFYYDNGAVFEISSWKKGLPNGNFKTYYKSGQLKSSGKFINGKREGYFRYYDEQGEIMEKHRFVNDKEQ